VKLVRTAAALAVAAGSTLALALPAAAAAPSETIYAVTSGGNRFIVFSSSNPSTAGNGTAITGLSGAPGEVVVGIDVRAATNVLYALTDDNNHLGRLYTLDPTTAVATPVSPGTTVDLTDTAANAKFDIDFNPCADRLRVVDSNGLNIRINQLTGGLAGTDTTLSYPSGDTNAGSSPAIAGIGYTGAVTTVSGGTTSCATTLYDADFIANSLARQGSVGGTPTSPNTGQLATVGPFGVDPNSVLGFDISGATGTAYLAAQINNSRGLTSPQTLLYSVDLSSGTATPVQMSNNVGSDILGSIAVAPASTTPTASLPELPAAALAPLAGMAVLGGAALVRRRRSRV